MFGTLHLVQRRFSIRKAALLALALLAMAAAHLPTLAIAAATNPSGLPIPRFVTTRSNPINVRVGPGTRYDVAWVYVKAGTPVEIIQEFDTWRKIRDVDGSEGWLHQNLLQGKRAGLVAPWKPVGEQVALLRSAEENSGVRAWLTPNFRVDIKECDGKWCEVVATTHPEDVILLKGNMPLEVRIHQRTRTLVYASEARILDRALTGEAGWEPLPLAHGEGLVVNTHAWTLRWVPFTFQGLDTMAGTAYTGAITRKERPR